MIVYLLAFLLCAAPVRAEELNKIIAVVNNKVITAKDLDNYCTMILYQQAQTDEDFFKRRDELKQTSLAQLIDEELIADYARKQKEEEIKNTKDERRKKALEIPESVITARIEQIAASYASREHFEANLADKGISVSVLRERFKKQYLVQEAMMRYVRRFTEPSPQKILDYYQDHADELAVPATTKFLIGKSNDTKKLDEIAEYITAHGPGAAQKEFSGVLVDIEAKEGELKDEIAAVLAGLTPGMARVTRIDDKPSIVCLVERKKRRVPLFEEVSDHIMRLLEEESFKEQYAAFISELESKAVIDIKDAAYLDVMKRARQ